MFINLPEKPLFVKNICPQVRFTFNTTAIQYKFVTKIPGKSISAKPHYVMYSGERLMSAVSREAAVGSGGGSGGLRGRRHSPVITGR